MKELLMVATLVVAMSSCSSCSSSDEAEATENVPTHEPLPTYTNPVWAKDWPDPTVWKGEDGAFYSISTNCETIIRSTNLVDWEDLHISPFDQESKDKLQKEGWNLWAPDVTTVNGQRLCYVACYNAANDATICVLKEVSTNHFEFVGVITKGKETGIPDTIDPEVVTDPETGKVWFFFGSIGGVHRIELTSDGTAIKEGAEYIRVAGLNIEEDQSRLKVLEGSYLHKRGDYWYLFVSSGWYYDKTYQMRVGRSKSLEGDFVDKLGNSLKTTGIASQIINSTNRFFGPGHNGEIYTDKYNRDFIVYHCHDAQTDGGTTRPMFLQELHWDKDGWPYFDPKVVVTEAEVPVFE